jgi:hypothetical protein
VVRHWFALEQMVLKTCEEREEQDSRAELGEWGTLFGRAVKSAVGTVPNAQLPLF